MNFGENLRKYLKVNGLSQKQAALELNYSASNLNHFLGGRAPNFEFIQALIKRDPDIDLNALFKTGNFDTGVNNLAEPGTVYMTKNQQLIEEIRKNLNELEKGLSQK